MKRGAFSWRAVRAAAVFGLLAPAAAPVLAAVNSYRFLHVTIDTPWHIFLFLLMGIFAPFILMVVLMWRTSARRRNPAKLPESGQDPKS
jgi:hypothetical protein